MAPTWLEQKTDSRFLIWSKTGFSFAMLITWLELRSGNSIWIWRLFIPVRIWVMVRMSWNTIKQIFNFFELGLFISGASWSSGLIRLPTAPRVGGSNPGRSFSFIRERSSSKLEWRNAKSGTGGPSREKKGGSGESKKKNGQAFQEWLRERFGSFRRRLNG